MEEFLSLIHILDVYKRQVQCCKCYFVRKCFHLNMSVKCKKATSSIEQKLQALFWIKSDEIFKKVTLELGVVIEMVLY